MTYRYAIDLESLLLYNFGGTIQSPIYYILRFLGGYLSNSEPRLGPGYC